MRSHTNLCLSILIALTMLLGGLPPAASRAAFPAAPPPPGGPATALLPRWLVPQAPAKQPALAETAVYTATIQPGKPMVMGEADLILEFAPGASGIVTATRISTRPVDPPPGGYPVHWEITTTAASYTATATFLLNAATVPITAADTVLTVDQSGSMEFETLCYGCWTPASGKEYPDGDFWPLPWNGPADGPPAHCAGNVPLVYSGYQYLIIEAEEYSRLSNPYARQHHTLGYTYWVLGRNGQPIPPYLGDAKALGRDSRGAYLAHHPGRSAYGGSDGTGVPCTWDAVSNPVSGTRYCRDDSLMRSFGGPYPAPRADYDFTVPESGQWQVWIRGQGGDRSGSSGDYLFWGITKNYQPGDPGTLLGMGDGFPDRGSSYANGADSRKWEWRPMGDQNGNIGSGSFVTLTAGVTYTLHFWAGAPGFDVDRIVVTNDPRTSLASTVRDSSHIDNNRTGWACDPCDPRFGGYAGGAGGTGSPHCPAIPEAERFADDLYDDEQPIRGEVEAFKRFARRADTGNDQVALVTYSDETYNKTELMCRKWAEETGSSCNAARIESAIVTPLDGTHAGGSTNIPDALESSIDQLAPATPHSGREAAVHNLILTTDGRANTYSKLKPENQNCYLTDYYPYPDPTGSNYERAADCIVYFTLRARRAGIVIHTMSLNRTADQALMAYVAALTGGTHHHVARVEDLPAALDAITPTLHQAPPDALPRRAVYHRSGPGAPWELVPLARTESGPYYAVVSGITDFSQWTLAPSAPEIALAAHPASLPADGLATATLTATVSNAPYPVADGTVVTFATTLSSVVPVTATTTHGVVTATLTASTSVGIAQVSATALGVTGTLDLPLYPEEPVSLTVEAIPTILPADGQSTSTISITVFYTETMILPVEDGTPVTLVASGGTIAPAIATTMGGVATATLTAGFDAGTATVTSAVGGVTGTTTVTLTPQLYVLYLAVQPDTLPADGQSTATITLSAFYSGTLLLPVTDGTPVSFAASGGTVAPTSGTTTDGVATATFTPGLSPGFALVTATIGESSESLAIALLPMEPASIELAALPPVLAANGISSSTLEATVLDPLGNPVADGSVVTFATTLGSVAPMTGTTANGTATATLTAGYVAGRATVTAATTGASGPISDTALVVIEPPAPYTLEMTVTPQQLSANGQSTSAITVAVYYSEFAEPVPVVDGTPVTFTVPVSGTPTGSVVPQVATTANGIATATFVAGTRAGTAVLTATTGRAFVTETLTLHPTDPATVLVTAHPQTLPADGISTSRVRAAVVDRFGNPIEGSVTITFATSRSTLTPTVAVTVNGVATTTLTASDRPGQGVVTATAGALQGRVFVQFAPLPPYAISLAAARTAVPTGESATITAMVVHTGLKVTPVVDGTVVSFTVSAGGATTATVTPPTATTVNGIATTTLTAGASAGRIVVTAAVDGTYATVQVHLGTILFIPLIVRAE